MTPRIARSIASVLVLLLIFLPGAVLAKQRRGAELMIARKNRTQVSGELIALKQDSLLLLGPLEQDLSVELIEVSKITVFKKSPATKGFLTGFLIGGLAGGIAGGAVNNDNRTYIIVSGALLFGFVGGFIGLAIGSAAGSEETIAFEGLPEAEVQKVKKRLRGMARMPDAQ